MMTVGVEQKDDVGGARVSWPGEVLELPVLTARDIANTDIRIEVSDTSTNPLSGTCRTRGCGAHVKAMCCG